MNHMVDFTYNGIKFCCTKHVSSEIIDFLIAIIDIYGFKNNKHMFEDKHMVDDNHVLSSNNCLLHYNFIYERLDDKIKNYLYMISISDDKILFTKETYALPDCVIIITEQINFKYANDLLDYLNKNLNHLRKDPTCKLSIVE